eukprot:14815127-Ditylum_brightwellii.AAC.1
MENAAVILGDLPLWHYVSRPTKMAFHDLTNSPAHFTPSPLHLFTHKKSAWTRSQILSYSSLHY